MAPQITGDSSVCPSACIGYQHNAYSSSTSTETKMSSFWRNFNHWLHWKLSFWQLPVQPVMKISSKWRHFRFSVTGLCLNRNASEKIAYANICHTVFMFYIDRHQGLNASQLYIWQCTFQHIEVDTKWPKISLTTISNAFSWLKIYGFRLIFHWNLFRRVKLIIFQHWFR